MPERPKALVTGSEGFIGKPLGRALERDGYEVTRYDRDADPSHDVLNASLVDEYVDGNNVVFHLAGLLGTELNHDGRPFAAVNVLGSVNVFEAARRAGARVVLASKTNPWTNMYSASKLATEEFANVYRELHGVDVRTAKMFNLYGPGQHVGEGHPIKIVPTFVMSALQGLPVEVFGSGNQTLDPMHVEDTAKALVLMGQLQNLNGETIQIGSGDDVTVNFLAEMIVALTDSSSPVVHIPMRSGEPDNATKVVADTTKMTNLLHFSPTVSLEDGLRETIEWYRREYFGTTVHHSIPDRVRD